ncbi:MAG: hypothetical protein KY453_03245 [Gemmatimonadetes bacterium]|nr:hypothetical protein [Gemmatimonadota bacterium]
MSKDLTPASDRPEEGRSGEEAEAPPARSGACELCGGPVVERHCKIECLNCGYQRDCSDP